MMQNYWVSWCRKGAVVAKMQKKLESLKKCFHHLNFLKGTISEMKKNPKITHNAEKDFNVGTFSFVKKVLKISHLKNDF